MEPNPLVSIVIVSYNGKKLLEQFSPSLAGQDYPNLEWVLVDNASVDDSVSWAAKAFPYWKVVRNPKNDGTAEGSNIGARASRGKFIFWVSNDMWFEPDCVSKIIKRMQSDPSIGICTCKMRRITPDLQKLNILDSLGGFIDFMGCPFAVGMEEEDHGQHDGLSDVFFSFGGAMMIRRDVFEQTNGYDPDTFTLADDIDLSWRSRLLGYSVCVEPSAVLYHRVSATLSKVGHGQRRFWSERNTLRMLLKNYAVHNLWWVLPIYFVFLSAELLFYLVLFRWDIGRHVFDAFCWNLSNFKKTLILRRQIQENRRIPDHEILRLAKKQPLKWVLGWDFLKNPRSPNWRDFFAKSGPSTA